MPTYISNSITITDSLDNINLELFISSNLPQTQVFNEGVYSPSWVTNPLKLTPVVYVRNQVLSNPNITWERRSGGQAYTSQLVSGESISNNVLTVNKDILSSDVNKIITYRCTVTYGEISRSAEISFTLNIIGSDGKDGSSVSIKGTAYTSESSYTVGNLYLLYSDAGKTTEITNAALGDSYLVGGYLFVYSGDEDNKFNCVGNIKGVGISSITGPVKNGLIDTYTINYSDGTKSTYTITNGVSPKALDLYASRYAIAYDAEGKLKDESPIILTSNQQNSTSTITWTVTEGATLSGTGNVRTLQANTFNNMDTVVVSVSADGLNDTVTIVKVKDGSVGPSGSDGQSTFVTYNDSESAPDTPTGSGISNGWHTDMTSSSIWMSLKTSTDIALGVWGNPVKIKGSDGKGVANAVITYQISTSGSSIPTGAWLPNLPAVTAGQYLWTRTITTFTDNTSVTGYSVSGVGTKGNDGKGIKTTAVTYQASTSGVTAPTGTWSATVPEVAVNQYLWTRTVITYTDDTTSTSYSIGRIGASGVDGYTVLLTNDSHTFAGSTSAAIAGSTTCNVIAYKGGNQVAATIGTISGLPTGMTATISNNSTVNALFTVSVTTSMTTRNGYLTVPITVDGKTFNKNFSYSIALKGDTGTSSVLFKIYSDTGFVFHNEDSITLKLQKLYGATNIAISGNNKVQWSKFVNGNWVNAWKYDSGDTSDVVSTGETLIVKNTEIDGSQLYRCVLTYNGQTYTDTVTITDKTDIYQSKIISLGGNILQGGEKGIVAYASMFYETEEVDKMLCPIYLGDYTPVANQIYYVLDGDSIVTKKYSNSAWVADDTIKQDYMYSWFIIDKYTGNQQAIGSGKVIYITNEIIAQSGIIQCNIGDISVCTEVFTDANDPIISSTQPDITTAGQLWLNTNDGILYAYRISTASWEPVNSGQNRTYTSAPIVKLDCCYYKKGDLWIVSESDSAYTDYKAGTLLVAIDNLSDGADSWTAANWKDRLAADWENKLYYDEELNNISEYQQKLSAYMNFEVDGLKIGANNTDFYTKVTPYDLGFYQGVEKVAYISNNKMYNTALEVSNGVQVINHKSNTQPNPQKPYFMLGNYKFIIEENNSMSIAYSLLTAPQPSVIKYVASSTALEIHFGPWSTNDSYGYRSNFDTTILSNIKLFTVEGTEISTTKTSSNPYIKVTASSALPSTVIVQIPEHSVYNKGVSGNTLGYDITDVGNDAITLTINI